MASSAPMMSINGFSPRWVQAALHAALARRAGRAAPVTMGVSGLQGSGKSSFAAQLVQAAQAVGLQAATLSIDDVYLTGDARRRLARQVHPLLATRGPAGTHDLELAHATLDAVAAGHCLHLPRFDKLADDRLPEHAWPTVTRPLDLLVFEGWFLGTPAEPTEALRQPLNVLERDQDPDGTWRRWCNTALGRDYPSLWARMDLLWVLQAPGFAIVPQWRWQQEQALQAAAGRPGMDRDAVARFVQLYERTSRHALRTLPTLADRVLQLDARRHVVDASA